MENPILVHLNRQSKSDFFSEYTKRIISVSHMKKKQQFLVVILFVICLTYQVNAQSQQENFKAMFYNVENLFDTINNPYTNDDEFLPDSEKRWNSYKYWRKIRHIYQVIAAVGENKPPEIIGLCEVEDFLPLYDIVYNTPLMKFNYQIIHFNSPDKRGIDVALLVNTDNFKILSSEPLAVVFEDDTAKTTRDILYARLLCYTDTLHVMVNHWPSRRGGEESSEKYRLRASNVLKSAVDSILQQNQKAHILVMGDFNDGPSNKSMEQLKSTGLINLSEELELACKCGSYKYKNSWHLFDQMLVSKAVLKKRGLTCNSKSLHIFRNEFITETDNTYGGQKLRRTYLGPKYNGGYSDHLPTWLELTYVKK